MCTYSKIKYYKYTSCYHLVLISEVLLACSHIGKNMITADRGRLMGATSIGSILLFCDAVNCSMLPTGLPAYQSRSTVHHPSGGHPPSRPSRHSEARMVESGPLLHRTAEGKGEGSFPSAINLSEVLSSSRSTHKLSPTFRGVLVTKR